MGSTNDNKTGSPIVFSLIKYILYFIGFIIVVITFLAIINYLLYAIYYFKELVITTEELYDVGSLKMTDIINYRLINYIKELNQTDEKNFNLNSNKCYDLKKLKYIDSQSPIKVKKADDVILETDFTEIIDNLKYNDEESKLKKMKDNPSRNTIIKILYDSDYKSKDKTVIDNYYTTNKPADKAISGQIKNYFEDKFPKNITLSDYNYNNLIDSDIDKIYKTINAKTTNSNIDDNKGFFVKYNFIDYENIENGIQNVDYYILLKLRELSPSENNEINLTLNKGALSVINKSLYDDIKNEGRYSLNQGNNPEDILPIRGQNGILGFFNIDIQDNPFNSFSRDVFGYALNSTFLLLPNNLYSSYDKDASNLYLLTNNKLYELIFALVFIIFIIIIILFTIDILIAIFINNNGGKTSYFMTSLAEDRHYYLIVVPIIFIIYCMMHSFIYYYIFIKGSYVKINESYDILIKPDEMIRDLIIKLFGKDLKYLDTAKNNISVNKKLLSLFQNISYGEDIDIQTGKYVVIDPAQTDKEKELKIFEDKMLQINKYFNYNEYNHEANYYTKIFFENYKNLYNQIDEANKNERLYLVLILTIYIYIVEWNSNDPYVLIKLNKLLFGRVANIGIKEIDDEIANTLTLRSIIPYSTTKHYVPENIENIYDKTGLYLDATFDTGVDNEDLIKFKKLFKEVLEHNMERGDYYFNLYLAYEMGLNILTILFTLIIIKLMSKDDEDSEISKNITYANILASWVVFKVTIAIFGLTNIVRM